MSISVVAHAAAVSANSTDVTTAGIDTTGATLLIIETAYYANPATPVPTDSKGNTWTPLTGYPNGPGNPVRAVKFFYAAAPTVGAGHTFTFSSSSSIYPAIAVLALSGTVASPFDAGTDSGTFANSGNIQPGSVTPTEANCIVVTGVGTTGNGGPAPTVDSPFTVSDALSPIDGEAAGIGLAYEIQTTATARNPTWTNAPNGLVAANIAAFKSDNPPVGQISVSMSVQASAQLSGGASIGLVATSSVQSAGQLNGGNSVALAIGASAQAVAGVQTDNLISLPLAATMATAGAQVLSPSAAVSVSAGLSASQTQSPVTVPISLLVATVVAATQTALPFPESLSLAVALGLQIGQSNPKSGNASAGVSRMGGSAGQDTPSGNSAGNSAPSGRASIQ